MRKDSTAIQNQIDNASFNALLANLSHVLFDIKGMDAKAFKNLLAYTIALQMFNDLPNSGITKDVQAAIIKLAFDFAEALEEEKKKRTNN